MKKYSELGIEMLNDVRDRLSFEFTATRSQLQFEDIEKKISAINFDSRFTLNNMSLLSALDLLAKATIEGSVISSITQMRIEIESSGGLMYYKKLGNGDLWQVEAIFPEAMPSFEFDSESGKTSVTIVNRNVPYFRIKNLYLEIGYENAHEMSLVDEATGRRLLLSLFERGVNPKNKTIFPRKEDSVITFNGGNIVLRLESKKPFKILLNCESFK